jgi:hypothetical protein
MSVPTMYVATRGLWDVLALGVGGSQPGDDQTTIVVVGLHRQRDE